MFYTCEEEYDDRFDDYAEDGEPVNRDPWYEEDDDEPVTLDQFMKMVL